jgi:hypothetical protein
MPNSHDLENWFSYYAPPPQQQEQYAAIRAADEDLRSGDLEHSPPSADHGRVMA